MQILASTETNLNMKERLYYHAPQAAWSELATGDLICDSDDSGIDDFVHEEIDWES